jgi:hypothetical protein
MEQANDVMATMPSDEFLKRDAHLFEEEFCVMRVQRIKHCLHGEVASLPP